MASNKRILLRSRPVGVVTPDNFSIVDEAVPRPDPGDVLVRNIYLSCDPYLRGRMGATNGFALDEVVPIRVVGQVEESLSDQFAVGDIVWGFLGWEEFTLVRGGRGLTRVRPELGPISHAVSVLGMPGLTAHVGMIEIGAPEPGQTVVVSAASGAVGSVAGQLAKMAGARVIGTAGTDEKVAHVVDTLGFDAAFNYKTVASLGEALDEHCPHGIDVYFDNVGGPLLNAILPRLSDHARVPVCGMISQYQAGEPVGITNLGMLVAKRAAMTGFTIYDHVHKLPGFLPRMAGWLRSGEIVYREDIVEGIENVPAAFIGMLAGDNIGKRLVRVGADPTLGPDTTTS